MKAAEGKDKILLVWPCRHEMDVGSSCFTDCLAGLPDTLRCITLSPLAHALSSGG